MRDNDINHSKQTKIFDLINLNLLRIDAEKYNEFTAMLDAPYSQNLGLDRLMAIKAPWRTDNA